MEKYRIAYIDEQSLQLRTVQRKLSNDLNVVGILPESDLDLFVKKLLESGFDAFVVDYQLNEYRDDVKEPISYNGVELLNKILKIRYNYPCFLLTSFDSTAASQIDDVKYVYPKKIIREKLGELTFAEIINIQIEHYRAKIKKSDERFHFLLNKSESDVLTETEEDELLELDTFLEKSINFKEALSPEKKKELAFGKISTLIDTTQQLLEELRTSSEQ